MFNIDIELIDITIGLIFLIIANIGLGASEAKIIFDNFDWKKLRQGILKAMIVIASSYLMYLAGKLNPDIIAINIDGQELNLMSAINIALIGGFIFYANECIKKLKLAINSKVGTEGL